MTWLKDFKAFINRGNVVELAVGVVIGAAFQRIVSSLVDGVFAPIVTLLVPVDLSNLFFVVKCKATKDNGLNPYLPFNCKGADADYDTIQIAQLNGATYFNLGEFILACVDFLVVALVLFWIIRMYMRMFHIENQKDKHCMFCMQTVDPMASRCHHCTSAIVPDDADPTTGADVKDTV
ncbi:Large-conductance mechanosensitive channel [Plasmodiophora brassicae]|uniref:Large-conductance mechanosensitive channel n=1 Tax=Plasmodiophora brassicae TaxID=37360 RepID=A0A0G4INU8_PLABS|nr:hypothetical protein PBRA_005473 [Plasmodiophora brassicae]SPR01827.1 unnamed protein product [Plasmodiophora brassicae]